MTFLRYAAPCFGEFWAAEVFRTHCSVGRTESLEKQSNWSTANGPSDSMARNAPDQMGMSRTSREYVRVDVKDKTKAKTY
jgi:hypothetical protein